MSYYHGNPFIVKTPLRNITSSKIVPSSMSQDILMYPEKGQERYETFLAERLLPTATKSIWDILPQLKLVRFATSNKKKATKVGKKVLKLRKDRKLYSKIIIIVQA